MPQPPNAAPQPSGPPRPPSLEELSHLPSNWGRWGRGDQRGTANLVDGAARARAALEVRSGRSVSLALPVRPVPFSGAGPLAQQTATVPAPAHHLISHTGSPPPAVVDVLLLNNHNGRSTHLDALVHVPLSGSGGTYVYPGVPLHEAVGPTGITHGSTTPLADGIVTRGVLLDLAPGGALAEGHPVSGADLGAALEVTGVALEPGDAVVVRGGWVVGERSGERLPGLTVGAVTWLHERDVSVYLGDVGDAQPPVEREVPLPLHQVGLARLGMPLVDSVAVEDLAAACRQEGRSTFMLVIAPPRVEGLTGVPVNPQAIF
ncbi:cyclase family protein [Kineococcus gypseus]|uniref:cyclase family protein n=1 Tax=Kineococcus gypseus TaxID=1637102 RepID=UPI003D7DCE0A